MTDVSAAYERAERERESGNNIEAGEWYTSTAFLQSGKMPLYPSSGGDLKHFLEAATCYRIGGRMDRCRNRCQTGILRATDLSDRAMGGSMPDHDVQHADRGGWQEAIGMFRIVGNLDDVEEAYNRAFEIYEAAGDPESHRTETPKSTLYTWFRKLELAATQDTPGISFRRDRTYTEYANYVREKIPMYLQILEQKGEWRSLPNDEEMQNDE